MSESNTSGWMLACAKWLLICLLFSVWTVPALISCIALAVGWPAWVAADRLWTKIKQVRGGE